MTLKRGNQTSTSFLAFLSFRSIFSQRESGGRGGLSLFSRRSQNQAAVDAFLRHVEVRDYPDEAALHYAQIRAALKISGAMIGANDLLIAAHARCLGLTLVTNNTREFGRIQDLHIENWSEPKS